MLALRFKDDDVLEVGIDEAGRGCFWGPLVAGACSWPPRSAWTAEHESGHPDFHCIVEGDGTYLNSAAASILAKVEHDRWVQATCDAEPGLAERYGLRTWMGYGTAVHRAGLKEHGPHRQHRTLFVRNWIPSGLHSMPSNGKENKPRMEEPCLIKL